MKIAAHVIAYDVNRFINPMLRNVAPWVDKIYVAHAPRPFAYNPGSREQRTNPTQLADIVTTGLACPVEIVRGDWPREEEARNECLNRAKAEGFDWFITQDADEFYTEDSWKQMRRALGNSPGVDCFRTTWYNFWKSSDYVVVYQNDSIKHANIGFALRCRPELSFANRRVTNATTVRMLDASCYHYGYALTDDEMYRKITQWSHTGQFNAERWFNLKWRKWHPGMVNLDMIFSRLMKRAVPFPLHQPDFAAEFALPVVSPKLTAGDRAADWLYDSQLFAYEHLRNAKRLALGQGY